MHRIHKFKSTVAASVKGAASGESKQDPRDFVYARARSNVQQFREEIPSR